MFAEGNENGNGNGHDHRQPIGPSRPDAYTPSPSNSLSSLPSSEEDEDDGYTSDHTEHIPSVGRRTIQKPLPPPPLPVRRRGYELCSSCVETIGVEHSKRFFKVRGNEGRWDFRRGAGGAHCFREIVWGGKDGWKNVGMFFSLSPGVCDLISDGCSFLASTAEYGDDSFCSICNDHASLGRYRCEWF